MHSHTLFPNPFPRYLLLLIIAVDNSTGGKRSDVGSGVMYEPDWTVSEFADVLGVLKENGI